MAGCYKNSRLYNRLYEHSRLHKMHNRAMSYVNEPSQAALERANQNIYDVHACSKAAVWTVDVVVRL